MISNKLHIYTYAFFLFDVASKFLNNPWRLYSQINIKPLFGLCVFLNILINNFCVFNNKNNVYL